MIFELLPDDIIDKIYSKIIYNYPEELLEEIKTYKKKNKFIKKFNNIENIDDKLDIFYDILVIYYMQKENKIPTSVNSDELTSESMRKIAEIFSIDMSYLEKIDEYLKKVIRKYVNNIDNYYLEKILH
jgi:hypothetical protein